MTPYAFECYGWLMTATARTLFLTLCAITATTLALALVPLAGAEEPVDPVVRAAVDHPERPERDRGEDVFRAPDQVLTWLDIKPGMVILDVFTGTGWYAELLARVVGAEGHVYAQNPPWIYTKYPQLHDLIEQRLSKLENVERWDLVVNEMGTGNGSLDGVMINLVFHDLFWLSDDVPDVVADIYAMLKPGGWVALIDHAAPAGTGSEYAQGGAGEGPHRIDEAFARRMFLDAGFVLESENLIFRQAGDDRSKAFFDENGPGKATDRFALQFRKPAW